MDMKAVHAHWQGFEIRGENQAVGRFTDGDATDGLWRAIGTDQVDRDLQRRRLGGADREDTEQAEQKRAIHKSVPEGDGCWAVSGITTIGLRQTFRWKKHIFPTE
jgi:hypothetical protein